jgi:MFS family permease
MDVSAPAVETRSGSAPRVFYGWVVLLVAAAAMVGTLPGRTQGLGLVTEPLLRDLALDRVTYAEINFWATILGSAFAIGVGRVQDRFGSRAVLTVVALFLGIVVCLMSRATSVGALAVWVTLTRGLGQSALSVVSLAMVGQWFVRRIDTAMAVYSIVMSVGFMMAFPLVGAIVQSRGWRDAWLAVGVALVAGLAPVAAILVRRSPEAFGVEPDGDSIGTRAGRRLQPASADRLPGRTWREAVLAPAFWVFAIGASLYGLVASGIGLFNESILAERGFGPDVYYRTLVVTAVTALAGNFFGGWLAGRVPLGRLLAVSLCVLTAGLAALPYVTTEVHVMAWAVAMGLGGGLVMVLFFSVWPRVFGRRHLGRIQGTAQALTVLASALGPLLLAWCIELTGSYRGMFQVLAAVIAVAALAALLVRIPAPVDVPARHARADDDIAAPGR